MPRYNVVLKARDLRRDTFRCGGPGGQNQNKVETGVRYTHLPTGVAAESRSERSQSVNDEAALDLLKEKLLRLWLIARGQSARDTWSRKPDASYGQQFRTYKIDGPSKYVVDHETGWQGDPRRVLAGDLDGLLRARLLAAASRDADVA